MVTNPKDAAMFPAPNKYEQVTSIQIESRT